MNNQQNHPQIHQKSSTNSQKISKENYNGDWEEEGRARLATGFLCSTFFLAEGGRAAPSAARRPQAPLSARCPLTSSCAAASLHQRTGGTAVCCLSSACRSLLPPLTRSGKRARHSPPLLGAAALARLPLTRSAKGCGSAEEGSSPPAPQRSERRGSVEEKPRGRRPKVSERRGVRKRRGETRGGESG